MNRHHGTFLILIHISKEAKCYDEGEKDANLGKLKYS